MATVNLIWVYVARVYDDVDMYLTPFGDWSYDPTNAAQFRLNKYDREKSDGAIRCEVDVMDVKYLLSETVFNPDPDYLYCVVPVTKTRKEGDKNDK